MSGRAAGGSDFVESVRAGSEGSGMLLLDRVMCSGEYLSEASRVCLMFILVVQTETDLGVN